MGVYVINLDECADVGTHWIALFCNRSEIVYFNSFGVEHVPEEIEEFIRNKNIIANIFRVQANHSIMCGYVCMFFPYDFKKYDDIILTYFKDEWNQQNKLVRTDKIRLSKIIRIKDYFQQEINQRKSCSKNLSKYVTAFDYIDKILIVLSATSSGVCIILSASVVGAPFGIASAGFALIFSLTTGIIKKNTKNNKKQKEKPW